MAWGRPNFAALTFGGQKADALPPAGAFTVVEGLVGCGEISNQSERLYKV
jgi:hypothetical protein